MRGLEALIGFGHQMRVGKDTAGNILVKELGFKRFAYADVVREYAYSINPLVLLSATDYDLLDTTDFRLDSVEIMHRSHTPQHLSKVVDALGWEQAKTIQSVRTLLQDLGQQGRVVIGENVWVNALFQRIDASDAERVVITDVRHNNEAARIREAGGVTVHIRRNYTPISPNAKHLSEQGLSDGWADYVIDNNTTLSTFEENVLTMVYAAFP